MLGLAEQKCEACRAGAPLVTAAQIEELAPQVPEWKVVEIDNVKRLTRAYKFADFAAALGFTIEVGGIAEGQGHHPEMTTGYGHVMVSWWTHAIGGVHKTDFIMAARTDRLYEAFARKS